MAKFNKFIEEVRKIRGLKSISVEYDISYDSIFIKFDSTQWIKIDNENSTTWKKFRELHITPDWLLIYTKNKTELILTLSRTGSHSELLKL